MNPIFVRNIEIFQVFFIGGIQCVFLDLADDITRILFLLHNYFRSEFDFLVVQIHRIFYNLLAFMPLFNLFRIHFNN